MKSVLPISISDLLNKRNIEHNRIEYKADWNPEPTIHSICAFANDIDNLGGGYILIGVEENENGMAKFPIKGLPETSIKRIEDDIFNKSNYIQPRYIPIISQEIYDEKLILVLWIPGGEERPYRCGIKIPEGNKKPDDKSRAYFIRKGSHSIIAKEHEEKELIALSGNIPYDDRPNYSSNVNDLKISLISQFLSSVQSNLYDYSLTQPLESIAMSMKILGGPIESRKPINVGLMFFNDRPDDFFRYAQIEVIDKPDPTGEGMTEKIFNGPLDRQLKDALLYIKNYVIKEKIIKISGQAEALRIYNYPYDAVEEALTNAVYHKSYQIPEPITVTITPDKMEITSLPGPDRSISNEDIQNRRLISRRYRNRRIGDYLKELDLAEGRNTGVPTIVRAMNLNGSDLPIFLTDEDRTYFTVVLPVQHNFLKTDIIQNDSITEQKKNVTQKRRQKTDTKKQIIQLLKQQNEMSMLQIAREIGYSSVNNTLRTCIKELLDENIIAYTVSDKLHSSKQKIRLLEGNN